MTNEQSTDEVFLRVSNIWFEVTLKNNNNSVLLLSNVQQQQHVHSIKSIRLASVII